MVGAAPPGAVRGPTGPAGRPFPSAEVTAMVRDEFEAAVAESVREHEAAGPGGYDPVTGCRLFPTGAVMDGYPGGGFPCQPGDRLDELRRVRRYWRLRARAARRGFDRLAAACRARGWPPAPAEVRRLEGLLAVVRT